ncbi:hypothetical protein [Roseiconus lacunae]|uniref:hypothetical protein n=1 Tax=Roseiconus lacunae TaxID=2605694 RepID=UPI001E3E92FC|nr:hypothetical protein [Roseiconus lacunae]
MLEEIDFIVGCIVDTLEELVLAENIYVFFTSDSGPWHLKSKGNADGHLPRDSGESMREDLDDYGRAGTNMRFLDPMDARPAKPPVPGFVYRYQRIDASNESPTSIDTFEANSREDITGSDCGKAALAAF